MRNPKVHNARWMRCRRSCQGMNSTTATLSSQSTTNNARKATHRWMAVFLSDNLLFGFAGGGSIALCVFIGDEISFDNNAYVNGVAMGVNHCALADVAA